MRVHSSASQPIAGSTAVANLARDEAASETIDRMPWREDLREMSFDQDVKGRFHLLTSTTAGRLYYLSEGRGPVLVAQGEDRFFPVVAAPLKIYLGCYRKDYGYRFLQYRRRSRGPKILGLQAL